VQLGENASAARIGRRLAFRVRGLLAEGVLIAAGPCLGQVNTGIAIFEAPDQEAARRLVADEPVTSGGYMPSDLRPYRLGLLRGRD
jgi:hypothetical protein